MNRVKIQPGKYRAVTPVVLSQYQGSQQLNYSEIEQGREFEVPEAVGRSGFGYFLTYSPDFGDSEPVVERI